MATGDVGLFQGAAQPIYNNTIRPLLPKKWGVLNGVAVRTFRLFDFQDTQPDHKEGLLSAIREIVSPTDSVVDIALGRGITATVVAREGGTVHTYEAAQEMIDIGKETLKHNKVEEDVHIHHALVEAPGELFGDVAQPEQLSTGDLPDVDVWVLDCEGAETSILRAAQELDDLPRAIIVESHPQQGAPADEVATLIEGMEYTVESRQFEPGEINPDKRVLVAERS